MEIKVVENMDVPPRTRTRVYPFRDMKIGSGFKVLFNSTDPQVIDRVSKKIRSAVGNYHKEHPDFVYETRTVGADDQSLQTPLSSLQHSLIASAHRQDTATPNDPITVKKSAAEAKSLKTYEDALNYLHPDAPRL